MNLLRVLRSRIDALPEGDYILGLRAVLQHIDTAARHLERGRSNADETAFTDAIYRTNQAFEGSLKEAYRVLADRDPAGMRPFDIETYIQSNNLLRPRVLTQLTNYRTAWRNPSTHDYRLDFDEDEALLAIVNVSAFAVVLIDQITERVSFEQAKAVASEQPAMLPEEESLSERMVHLLREFTAQFNKTHTSKTDIREAEITGALGGFLSSVPGLRGEGGHIFFDKEIQQSARPDFLLKSKNEQLILEVKRAKRFDRQVRRDSTEQVARYMRISGINQAILFVYTGPDKKDVKEESFQIEEGQLFIISTK